MEDAVAAVGAFCQCLGIVLKGVWWRFGAFVADFQESSGTELGVVAFKLVHDEVDVGAVVLNGAGDDEALNAKLGVVGLVSHAAEFGDGDVIALVGAVAGSGEPNDGADDDDGSKPDAQGIRGSFHAQPFQFQPYECMGVGSTIGRMKCDFDHTTAEQDSRKERRSTLGILGNAVTKLCGFLG